LFAWSPLCCELVQGEEEFPWDGFVAGKGSIKDVDCQWDCCRCAYTIFWGVEEDCGNVIDEAINLSFGARRWLKSEG
jgi:hypothetical protein